MTKTLHSIELSMLKRDVRRMSSILFRMKKIVDSVDKRDMRREKTMSNQSLLSDGEKFSNLDLEYCKLLEMLSQRFPKAYEYYIARLGPPEGYNQ